MSENMNDLRQAPIEPMSQEEMRVVMDTVFTECHNLRVAGQKEYAGISKPAFSNFERVGTDLDISREKALWIFAMKHRDGIAAYIRGHKSQREDVRGRINDLIVYLCLLRGMIDERDGIRYTESVSLRKNAENF